MILDYQKLRLALLVSVVPLSQGACNIQSDATPPVSNHIGCDGGESRIIYAPDGQPSGYERCDNGNVHKSGPANCSSNRKLLACNGTEEVLYCNTDADCTNGPNGYCASDEAYWGGGYYEQTFCGCRYLCATDSDCGEGMVCACGSVADGRDGESYCIPADCDMDLSCDSDECGLSSFTDACDTSEQMACRTDQDECASDSDCGSNEQCVAQKISGETRWVCEEASCTPGRPLRIAGAGRMSESIKRLDWMGAVIEVDIESLSAADRRRLRDHWLQAAQVEHSSVAAFNRASLQLMALGAPADLLRHTQQAAIDEIEHTQISYAMASVYGDGQYGPGPLTLGDLNLDLDWESVMIGLIEEACVGEAMGVAEALAAAENVQSISLRKALLQIARDEERHVQLAWRTLRWILECQPALLNAAASTLLQAGEALLGPKPTALQPVNSNLRAHGYLDAKSRYDIRERTLHGVVLPVFEALSQSLRAAA